MKNNKKLLCILATLLIISVLALFSCGGGGGDASSTGGGKTNVALTSENAPQAAAAVSQAVGAILPVVDAAGDNALPGAAASMPASSGQAPIKALLMLGIAAAQKQMQQSAGYAAAGSNSYSDSCANGGSFSVSISWDRDADFLNLRGNVTFNACREATTYMNGTMSLAFTGSYTSPTAVNMTANLTYEDSYSSTRLTMSALNFYATDVGSGLDFSQARIVMSGSISGTAQGETIRDFRCDNLTVDFGLVGGGRTMSVSGRVRSACLDTWLTLSTATPVTMPTGSDCPTAGDITATVGADATRLVVHTNTSIDLYFNGTLKETYSNCNAINAECT